MGEVGRSASYSFTSRRRCHVGWPSPSTILGSRRLKGIERRRAEEEERALIGSERRDPEPLQGLPEAATTGRGRSSLPEAVTVVFAWNPGSGSYVGGSLGGGHS